MLKKFLILGAIVGAGFMLFGNTKTSGSTATNDDIQLSDVPEVLQRYNGYLIQDKDGFWMLVKNGKVYLAESDAVFYSWSANHPDKVKTVPETVWNIYANTDYDGGTFDINA